MSIDPLSDAKIVDSLHTNAAAWTGAGAYVIRAVPAGTAAADRSASVVITSASTTFAGEKVRTVVAADAATGGVPLRAVVLADR